MRIRHTVYVAAYSTVRLGGGKGKVDLATTLTIHNTSEKSPLILLRADYFDTAGNLLHHYLPSPIAIRPLGSVETFVPAEDTRGGTGANFVVEWAAEGNYRTAYRGCHVRPIGAQASPSPVAERR